VNETVIPVSELSETLREPTSAPSIRPFNPVLQEPRPAHFTRGRIFQFLATPWADKAIAIMACYPCAHLVYGSYRAGLMDVPRALFLFEMALFVVTMLIRRTPVRITADPWYWLVALLASYYGFFLPGLLGGGVKIAPALACNALAVLGVWVAIFARLSLGRNIGLVPAQRRIVTGGAYGYVRHPIYTAHFLCSLAFGLSCYSVVNAFAIALGCGLWVVKTFMEESFLAEDREYVAYMEQVRWRWFPGL
jgi:protein-S-isoprenylcysteine O-methyltransferase Ste14